MFQSSTAVPTRLVLTSRNAPAVVVNAVDAEGNNGMVARLLQVFHAFSIVVNFPSWSISEAEVKPTQPLNASAIVVTFVSVFNSGVVDKLAHRSQVLASDVTFVSALTSDAVVKDEQPYQVP